MIGTIPKYKVWDNGVIHSGDAHEVLEALRAAGAVRNDELQKMNVDTYAAALIEDAPYFMDETLLRALEQQTYSSLYDKALAYLASSPTSRVRIIGRD